MPAAPFDKTAPAALPPAPLLTLLAGLLLAGRPSFAVPPSSTAERTSACPEPPLNPAVSQSNETSGAVGARVGVFRGEIEGQKVEGVTYAGTGLSQQAADQAWKVYQLCRQAEAGLIPKDVYVDALRAFYGFGSATATVSTPLVPVALAHPAAPTEPPPEAPSLEEPYVAEPAPEVAEGVAGDDAEAEWACGGDEAEESSLPGDAFLTATASPMPAEEPPRPALPNPPVKASISKVDALTSTQAAPSCAPVLEEDRIHARMKGAIGIHEALAWSPSARAGWLWSTKALGLTSQMVRIWPDGSLDTPSLLDLEALGQNLSTLDPSGWIGRVVEGTVWGGELVEVEGWRVVGDQGVVVAIREGMTVDLGASFGQEPPAMVYQLPVVDDSEKKSLLLSIDPGRTQADTLIRTWWLDTTCLAR